MTMPTLTRPVIEDTSSWRDMPTNVVVNDVVRKASNAACSMKERGCEENDHYDICPTIEFYKDGVPILMLVTKGISRDNALAAARIAAGPVQPDAICITLDAHVTQEMNNPKTGKPWGPGEMQASCDDEGACATGLLTDCLVTMAVFSDGHHEHLQRRYRGHETAGNLVWLGEGDAMVSGTDNNQQVTGYVVEHLAQSLAFALDQSPRLAEAEAEVARTAAAEGISEKMQFWHKVCAGAKLALLSGASVGALVCAPDEEVATMVNETMSQERLDEDRNGSLGFMALMLAVKLGVE